jgi:hypothetical protein
MSSIRGLVLLIGALHATANSSALFKQQKNFRVKSRVCPSQQKLLGECHFGQTQFS